VDTIDIAVLYLPLLREESSWGIPERRRRVRLPRRRERRIPVMPSTSDLAFKPGVTLVSS
jgi:hypothetical protein